MPFQLVAACCWRLGLMRGPRRRLAYPRPTAYPSVHRLIFVVNHTSPSCDAAARQSRAVAGLDAGEGPEHAACRVASRGHAAGAMR